MLWLHVRNAIGSVQRPRPPASGSQYSSLRLLFLEPSHSCHHAMLRKLLESVRRPGIWCGSICQELERGRSRGLGMFVPSRSSNLPGAVASAWLLMAVIKIAGGPGVKWAVRLGQGPPSFIAEPEASSAHFAWSLRSPPKLSRRGRGGGPLGRT